MVLPVVFLSFTLFLADWASSAASEVRTLPVDGPIVQMETAILSLPELIVGPGSQITVPLTLGLAQGQVFSVDLVVAYDPAIANALGVQRGANVAGWSIAINMDTPGMIRVALAGSAPLETGSELFLLTFEAVGPAGSSTNLTLTRGDLNEGSLPATLYPGSLSIASPTVTATQTSTPTITDTPTATATATTTSTATATPSASPTNTRTATATVTATATATATVTNTRTATVTGTPSPTPTVANSAFVATVELQARGAAPSDRWVLPLTITLASQDAGEPVRQFESTTDPSGYFTVTSILPGTYDILIKKAHSLASKRNGVILPSCRIGGLDSTVEACPYLALGVLLDGDANDDGIINALDYSVLASSYLKRSGQAGFDERADFNDDSRINAADYAPLAVNYFLSDDE